MLLLLLLMLLCCVTGQSIANPTDAPSGDAAAATLPMETVDGQQRKAPYHPKPSRMHAFVRSFMVRLELCQAGLSNALPRLRKCWGVSLPSTFVSIGDSL